MDDEGSSICCILQAKIQNYTKWKKNVENARYVAFLAISVVHCYSINDMVSFKYWP